MGEPSGFQGTPSSSGLCCPLSWPGLGSFSVLSVSSPPPSPPNTACLSWGSRCLPAAYLPACGMPKLSACRLLERAHPLPGPSLPLPGPCLPLPPASLRAQAQALPGIPRALQPYVALVPFACESGEAGSPDPGFCACLLSPAQA